MRTMQFKYFLEAMTEMDSNGGDSEAAQVLRSQTAGVDNDYLSYLIDNVTHQLIT